MKNTRLLFVIWMLFLVLPQGYSQEKKEDSSVLGQVNGFLSKHVKLTAYGQFGYSYTDRKDLDVSQADNQFFGRLGMLILSGDITDKLSWMVQYELFTSQLLKLYASTSWTSSSTAAAAACARTTPRSCMPPSGMAA